MLKVTGLQRVKRLLTHLEKQMVIRWEKHWAKDLPMAKLKQMQTEKHLVMARPMVRQISTRWAKPKVKD